MLGSMRKHAGSWVIKLVFGLIILSFALFFGYNQIESSRVEAERLMALVGDRPISRQEYEARLDEAYDRIRESLKGEAPPNLETLLKSTILQQLISREVSCLFANSLGIEVSDPSVARAIQQDPSFSPQGTFDLAGYQRYRSLYRQRYGEDWEMELRKRLALERLEAFGEIAFGPWNRVLQEPDPKAAPIDSRQLLSQWMDPFRERTKIKLYRNRS